MRFVFVTLDPERDTPEQLALYLSDFDPRGIGLPVRLTYSNVRSI